MNKQTLLLFGLLAGANALWAQKTEFEYIAPPAIQGSNYKIEISDAVAKEDYNKLKLTLENTSQSHYYRLNMEKTGFNIAGLGTYYSKRGKDMLAGPGDKRSAVAEVSKNAAYVVPSYELQINGLSSGKIPDAALPVADFGVEVGKGNSSAQNGFSISTLKVEQSKKKDKVTAQIKVMFNGQDNEMGLVDLSHAVILDKNGVRVGEFDIKPNKTQELLNGDDFKININITSMETAFTLSWVGAFKLVSFNPENVAPVTMKTTNITSTTTGNTTTSTVTTANGTTTTTVVNTNCSAYQENNGGKVKVNIYNSEGECFLMTINGVTLPQETANATMYQDYGQKNISLKFSSGVVITEKVTVFDTWEAVTYRIKKNKKGEYVLNCDLTSVVLNEKGKNQQQATAAAAAGQNSSSNSSSGGSNISQNPNHKATTGSTKLRFRFMNAGVPIANCFISIKSGDAVLASGTTGLNGSVTMYTNAQGGFKVDLYGDGPAGSWNVSNFYSINITGDMDEEVEWDIAKSMKEAVDFFKGVMDGGW